MMHGQKNIKFRYIYVVMNQQYTRMYKTLHLGKPSGKRPLLITRLILKDNIKLDLRNV